MTSIGTDADTDAADPFRQTEFDPVALTDLAAVLAGGGPSRQSVESYVSDVIVCGALIETRE
jgi:hypothetical protein